MSMSSKNPPLSNYKDPYRKGQKIKIPKRKNKTDKENIDSV